MKKEIVTTAAILSSEDIQDIKDLYQQLSPGGQRITSENINFVIEESCFLTVRHEQTGRIIAVATLAIYRKLAGAVGVIEDVVVDEKFRQQGIAKEMLAGLMEYGRTEKLKSISLTSQPSRVEANLLYCSLGFQLRETNTYRFTF